MKLCDERCQMYNRCQVKNLRLHCMFDDGDEEDDDFFLERITY